MFFLKMKEKNDKLNDYFDIVLDYSICEDLAETFIKIIIMIRFEVCKTCEFIFSNDKVIKLDSFS